MDINEVRKRLELAVSAGEHVPVVRAIVESDDLLALLADHARLQAGADDEAIERAAIALHRNGADYMASETPWHHLHEREWRQYRSWARAAIDAAKAEQP